MPDVREVWKAIRTLSDGDQRWLFAQLADWAPFVRFLDSLRKGGQDPVRSTIVFDGGSRGNPGPSYGSYALQLMNDPPQVVHVEFKDDMTNNEAEYEALIRALEDLRGRLTTMGADPRASQVLVHGDSRLVICQVTGVWKARTPRMLQRRNRVRELERSFAKVTFEQRDRAEIEQVLGH